MTLLKPLTCEMFSLLGKMTSVTAVVCIIGCGKTIHSCAEDGKWTEVQRQIQEGADVNGVDCDGRTPLMIAIEHGHSNIV